MLCCAYLKNSGYLFSATGISAMIGMLQGILVARLLGVRIMAFWVRSHCSPA